MSILDDLRAVKERFLSETVGGFKVREIYVTGEQAIEMYRRGILRREDKTIRLIVSPSGVEKLRKWLEENPEN